MDVPNPAGQLLALTRAHRLTDIVSVAVRLGLPEALAAGAADVASLATTTGSHPGTLYRLLRTLAAAGVLNEDGERRFSLTPVGDYLRADAPGSLAGWVALVDRPYMREAWANLEHSVRTGENSFAAIHGEDIWQWRGHEPSESAIFNRAMAALSAGVGAAVASAYDFGRLSVVADIGGGSGSLLAAVLRQHPQLRGVLFDQPAVVAQASEIKRASVADRVEVVGGDFFEAVPQGADVYLMKAILHDWEDKEAIAILRKIRSALADSGRLLVIERVIGPANEDLEGKLSDLHMLVMPGGRERTAEEWARLFGAGGFELGEIRPLVLSWQLLIGTPVS